jgi:hypothetical protein
MMIKIPLTPTLSPGFGGEGRVRGDKVVRIAFGLQDPKERPAHGPS